MRVRRRLRLMSDYGAGPLWDEDGPVHLAHLGIAPHLVTRMEAWQELFEHHFHWETGWRSVEAAEAYARQGRSLHRALSAEIGSWARIDLDLWPSVPSP